MRGRSGEPPRAEGRLPLRLGLGAAAGHQRHLAARGTGGLGPCPHRGRGHRQVFRGDTVQVITTVRVEGDASRAQLSVAVEERSTEA